MSRKLRFVVADYAKSLPSWQKILANLAFDGNRPISDTEPEIGISYERLKYELGLETKLVGENIIQLIEELNLQDSQAELIPSKLIKINNYKNVNALSENQTITFSSELTIIYGENASGKSGYSRLLSSAFYSRGDKVILPNILKPKEEQGEPKATFVFDIGGTEITRFFPEGIQNPEFKQFACFDSKAVVVHLEGSNELYVLPQEMEFFQRLAELVVIVTNRLKNEASSKKKENTFLDMFREQSSIRKIIEEINEATDIERLKTFIEASEPLEQKIKDQEEKCNALKIKSPKKAISEINDIKKQLSIIKNQFESLFKNLYNIDYLQKIKTAIEDVCLAQEESRQYGIESFKTTLFEAIGSSTWKEFILNMHSLVGEEEKRLGRKFPKEGDHCPLCLQLLSEEALVVFEKYFSFLKNKTEVKLQLVHKNINSIKSEVNELLIPDLKDQMKLYSWLEEEEQSSIRKSLDYDLKLLHSYKKSLNISLLSFDVNELPPYLDLDTINSIIKINIMLDEKVKVYDEENFEKILNQNEQILTELQHTLILKNNITKIISHVEDMKWFSKVNKEIPRISTRKITDKQKDIFNDYFNKQYKQLFYEETKQLDVRFQINIKPTGMTGKTSRKLDVLTYSPAAILSEGEQKVLALADFLTEIVICNIQGGIVFDDPVNSLDHKRKIYIAKRLVSESRKRQVIIFTHDIGFLADLINEAKSLQMKEKKDIYCHWISKSDDQIGVVTLDHRTELEADFKNTLQAEKYLKDAQQAVNPKEREQYSKKGFDCLRKTYEAFIIYKLFGGTVIRFDRQIKYGQFKEVYCPKDYVDYVSQKLAYCSSFVDSHLGSDQYSGEKVSPELLEKEINCFKELNSKFTKEKNSATAK